MLSFLETDKDLLKYSSFHTPATARYFFELREKQDIPKLHNIWGFAQENNLPIVFLGSGTNILFAFDIFEGIIIRNTLKGIEWKDNIVTVATGELISPLSLQISKKISEKFKTSEKWPHGPDKSFIRSGDMWNSCENRSHSSPEEGLSEGDVLKSTTSEDTEIWTWSSHFTEVFSLFGKWVGLPGTVGGAVAGNAGCFGFEAKDTLIQANIFDMETGEYITLRNKELDFSYRHSILKDYSNWFLVDTIFRTNLISDDTTNPRTFRSGKQPGGFTCGSFFRNPPWDSAGRLIDQVWLKGHRIGGVKVSEVHANFFLNDKKGSYQDILTLRDLAKEKVQEMFGIELQEEVRIIENK